jgi:transposase
MNARTDPCELDARVKLVRGGCTAEEMAQLYGIGVRAVQRRLRKRGLRCQRRMTAAARTAVEMRRGLVHRLRGRGLSVIQMAVELGLRPRYLRLWMSRYMADLYDQMKGESRARDPDTRAGRKTARDEPARAQSPPLTPWRRAAIKKDYLTGYSIGAIARRYGHHATTIWRLLRRQGVPLRPRTSRSPMWLRAVRRRRTTREEGERMA